MKLPDFSRASLGIELGSTRIKAVLIDENYRTLAVGSHAWENSFVDGLWTYSVDEILGGLQSCYAALKADVKNKYNHLLTNVGCIGISAMMHGYVVLDKEDKLLVPFRTWRNNNAEEAASFLTDHFGFPIPARWSIAHLYHAIINNEEHVSKIAFQTTLAGYVHMLLTGRKVLGVGEASGMFPIGADGKSFDEIMLDKFDSLSKGRIRKIRNLLPEVMTAGENAGGLTERGAHILDPDGDLKPGIMFCPPEGDAGTGMVATNSVEPGTGNISAGTSIFGMVVLDGQISKVYREIDMVTTPIGNPVAMVHCNNCTSEINAWLNIFDELCGITGNAIDKNKLFELLFKHSLKGDDDCGGVLSCNYVSGENITGIVSGKPLVVHGAESRFNLANFVKSQLYSCFVTLKLGLDILTKSENIAIDKIYAHGGIFKTETVAQRYLAAAVNAPIALMDTAGEGGAWGMAVLAAFALEKGSNLSSFLKKKVFVGAKEHCVKPDAELIKGFDLYTARFKKLLSVEKSAAVLEGI